MLSIEAVQVISNLFNRYPMLRYLEEPIQTSVRMINECLINNKKILICGNGGSAADCDHIMTEFMVGFLKKRSIPLHLHSKLPSHLADNLRMPLRALSLVNFGPLQTAIINDIGSDFIFAQQVLGLGDAGDIFIGISTSGNAVNVKNASIVAKALGLLCIGLTGQNGGDMKNGNYNVLLKVPAKTTPHVQELHLPLYHAICAAVEASFF